MFNYKLSIDQQIATILEVTEGEYSQVFDASTFGGKAGMAVLGASTSRKEKYFATTNDW